LKNQVEKKIQTTNNKFTFNFSLRRLWPMYKVQVDVSDVKGFQGFFEGLLDLGMTKIAKVNRQIRHKHDP
jgi:hypothetical protein